MSATAAYLIQVDDAEGRDPMAYTPEFSRRARAVPVYAAIRALGRDGVARLVDGCCDHARAFADDHDDMNFTPSTLSTITASTLIVHGDRDPLYPVEQAVELLRGIPNASLWVVPNGGHGPIFGDQAAPFVRTATAFLTP